MGASKTAQWVKVSEAKPEDPSSMPGSTWEKERNNFYNLFFDLKMHHVNKYINVKNFKMRFYVR